MTEAPTDAEVTFAIEDLAAQADVAPWIAARSVARLIRRGMINVIDGTPDDAIVHLRRIYGEAVNGN